MKIINALLVALFVISSTLTYAGRWGGHGGGFGRGGHGPQVSPGRGGFRGHGYGRIGNPARFNLGRRPYGGWRGSPYYWGGRNYFVWGWEPYSPFYSWQYYYGWRIGLFYYIPEGIRCYSDNAEMPLIEWKSLDQYYSSEDAINSAMGYCENDPQVVQAGAQGACRIRNCVRW
jgi:hypothetical protein